MIGKPSSKLIRSSVEMKVRPILYKGQGYVYVEILNSFNPQARSCTWKGILTVEEYVEVVRESVEMETQDV